MQSLQDLKYFEDKLNHWTSIDEQPPLKEVEVLRLLDKMDEEHLSNRALSVLYCLLAFYRLQRNFNDSKITETLLNKAEALDHTTEVLQDIKGLQVFFNIYSELEGNYISGWTIRETDFVPVKIKKLNELLENIDQILENNQQINPVTRNTELASTYDQILNELISLKNVVKESISALENKKSDIPVQKLNDYVKNITRNNNILYSRLPDVFKTSLKQTPLEQLDNMIGLKKVKKYIQQYYHYLKYQKERKQLGFKMVDEPGIHMIITGNPGTGKTTIARLLAAIYNDLGLLSTNNVTEVNRSHLVGSYVGQSEENTVNYVKNSINGVLFIDEAYSLKREGQSGNDYGQAVIDTLVTSMTSEEYAGRFAVILAGYPDEMRQFLWANPGLRSRFPEQNHITLPDFNMDELIQIAEKTALNNDYFFTDKALNQLESLIEKSRVDESFGNARTVKDLVLKAIFEKGAKKGDSSIENWLEHMKIDSHDLEFSNDTESDDKPMEKLEGLIGLTNIKQEVRKLSSFVRVQQQRKQNKLPQVPIQLHAVFSGNPGTGKTTVAKIYSQILRECGLLKRGHFVFASRSDLVAGYVGQTAIKTKQKIREALGGVLFIDEAYSLYRGEKDFGKEAIDTLVDEMTKHNENLVVILAGYKDEMNQFIASNPGLESRFKKYFEFKNYNPYELIEITKFHIDRYQYKITDEAIEYLTNQFSQSRVDGNARFVVNLIDEAIQYQALRMIDQNGENSEELFQQLTQQDFKEAWASIRGSN